LEMLAATRVSAQVDNLTVDNLTALAVGRRAAGWRKIAVLGEAHRRLSFLRKNMPYERMTGSAIRHRIRHYAWMAGISAKLIGAHVFSAQSCESTG